MGFRVWGLLFKVSGLGLGLVLLAGYIGFRWPRPIHQSGSVLSALAGLGFRFSGLGLRVYRV